MIGIVKSTTRLPSGFSVTAIDPPSGLHQVEYEQTEHYQVTKAFLDNPARQLDRLMS